MTTEKLKPCPFCGGKPLVMSCDGLSRETNLMRRKMPRFLIRCQKCNVRTKAYATIKELFNAWNRRIKDGSLL